MDKLIIISIKFFETKYWTGNKWIADFMNQFPY